MDVSSSGVSGELSSDDKGIPGHAFSETEWSTIVLRISESKGWRTESKEEA